MRASFATVMIIVLLALAPFASALEIHHELAAADHDGHEHSASDLCQWVQHHTGSTVLSIVPPLAAFLIFTPLTSSSAASPRSIRIVLIGPSRAPPTV